MAGAVAAVRTYHRVLRGPTPRKRPLAVALPLWATTVLDMLPLWWWLCFDKFHNSRINLRIGIKKYFLKKSGARVTLIGSLSQDHLFLHRNREKVC
jgi:hypothetical protein